LPTNVGAYALVDAELTKAHEPEPDAGPRPPYRALQQVLSAAWAFHRLAEYAPVRGQRWAQVTLPLVITAAPLYECSLNTEGALDTRSVQSTVVTAQPEVIGGGGLPLLVQVMNEAHFVGEWIPAIAQTLDAMSMADIP
jgi:hypothetical protein